MSENIVEMRDVTIKFGDLIANDAVSLSVKKGEIMALLGENGAGKSTLMKILYGLYVRNDGEVIINGQIMPKRYSPLDAIKLGISMVPQHFMLIDSFTVAENIVLGEEKNINKYLFNRKKVNKKVEELCKKNNINISPDSIVSSLPLGMKQKIEILKALYRASKVIILDEPTTVLTPQEVDELFVLLRSLQQQGITIILITHKLREVLAVSDRITVMRLGKKIATLETSNTNANELAATMVGKELRSLRVESVKGELSDPIIEIKNIHTEKIEERCNLKDFNLNLYSGKIIGVAGIDGNGQTELVEVLAGIKPISKGCIVSGNQEITRNSTNVMSEIGLAIIPEDRREQGLALDLSIRDNLVIGRRKDRLFVNRGVFHKEAINKYAEELIKKYDIRPGHKDAVCRFVSGGNQQKVVLARELEKPNLRVVVASQPTRGLDVGAIEFTHETLLRLREEGKAVLLISSDLDEIKALSDYIAVIRDGSIVAFKHSADFSVEEIGLYMGGESSRKVTA